MKRELQTAIQAKLAQGAWEEVVCPRCHGTGVCAQCKGTGIVGLMGIPCALCGGGGERLYRRWDFGRFPPRQVTVRETANGTGRCAGCAGVGKVYRDRQTGQTVQQTENDIANALRHSL